MMERPIQVFVVEQALERPQLETVARPSARTSRSLSESCGHFSQPLPFDTIDEIEFDRGIAIDRDVAVLSISIARRKKQRVRAAMTEAT